MLKLITSDVYTMIKVFFETFSHIPKHLRSNLLASGDTDLVTQCYHLPIQCRGNPHLLFYYLLLRLLHFFMNVTVNHYICSYWSDSNPRISNEVHALQTQKVGSRQQVFSVIEMYLKLLEDVTNPVLTDIIENDEHYDDHLFFNRTRFLSWISFYGYTRKVKSMNTTEDLFQGCVDECCIPISCSQFQINIFLYFLDHRHKNKSFGQITLFKFL